jgi:hypothetical protein
MLKIKLSKKGEIDAKIKEILGVMKDGRVGLSKRKA